MTEPLAPCYWDGPRPCRHDRGAPLPKPRPLSAWMSTHDCSQRPDGIEWSAVASPSMIAVQRERRKRERGLAGHTGPDILITATHQRLAS